MKAVMKTAAAARSIEVVEDAERPVAGPGEVVIRVKATAICGTDKHIYDWDESLADMVAPPYIPGHEFCGEVFELGPGVPARLAVGDYVSAEMHVISENTRQTRTGNGHVCPETRIIGIHENGCFAEFVKVPASNVIALDRKTIPIQVGAFLDALGNAVHTVFKCPVAAKKVAILGYGPIGAMCAAVAQFCGASAIYITDVNELALDRARRWADGVKRAGGGAVIEALSVRREDREESLWRIQKETGGGVDVAMEISGAPPAINDALKITANGGDVVLLGLPGSKSVTLDNYKGDLIFRGLTLHGIIGRKMYETWYQMLGLLGAGLQVGHIANLELPLEQFEDGMARFAAGEAQKVVLYPDPAYASEPLI